MLDLAKFDKREFDILVAKCGKTIGLKGEVKLIIYSDFLEVFTKGNIFLCKGANSQNLVKKNCAKHPKSRPLRGAKNREQGRSSASADFLLEADKRGSPPKSEKRQLLGTHFKKVGGSGAGGAALLRKEKDKANGWLVESSAELQNRLPRSPAFARNDEFIRDSSPTAQNDNFGGKSAESTFFLTLNSFNPHKNSATFAEITNIERAKNLTSMLLFSTKSLTQKQCILGENEHFWFEIIGRSVVENGEIIGVVSEIERIGSVDYLIISVDSAVFAKYPHIKAKRFYLPYISRYVLGAENGVVAVQDALLVLESS